MKPLQGAAKLTLNSVPIPSKRSKWEVLAVIYHYLTMNYNLKWLNGRDLEKPSLIYHAASADIMLLIVSFTQIIDLNSRYGSVNKTVVT